MEDFFGRYLGSWSSPTPRLARGSLWFPFFSSWDLSSIRLMILRSTHCCSLLAAVTCSDKCCNDFLFFSYLFFDSPSNASDLEVRLSFCTVNYRRSVPGTPVDLFIRRRSSFSGRGTSSSSDPESSTEDLTCVWPASSMCPGSDYYLFITCFEKREAEKFDVAGTAAVERWLPRALSQSSAAVRWAPSRASVGRGLNSQRRLTAPCW